MRKLGLLAILALSTASFCGCYLVVGRDGRDGRDGEDGADGKAFIAYSWLFGPFYYWSDDPGIPSDTILNGEYYETEPGNYEFGYIAWDDSVWEGEYTIYINEGEEGGPGEPGEPGRLFRDGEDGQDGEDGEDGADIYFEVSCYSIGAAIYEWDSPDRKGLQSTESRRSAMHDEEVDRAGRSPEPSDEGLALSSTPSDL